MAYGSTIQCSLRGQNQRAFDDRERQTERWRLSGVSELCICGRNECDEARRSVLYLARRFRRVQLPRSLQGFWFSGAGVPSLEQEHYGDGPSRLPMETRAMSIWLERWHAQLVLRPQTNHGYKLRQADGQQRTPDHEAGGAVWLSDTEQHEKRRLGTGYLWRKWYNAHSLRTTRAQMLDDGARPEVLRCNKKTLLEVRDW